MDSKTLRLVISGLAVLAIFAGAFGMLSCFPYLWSAKLEDLIGAGLPFVGGAIIFSAGLITLGIVNKKYC